MGYRRRRDGATGRRGALTKGAFACCIGGMLSPKASSRSSPEVFETEKGWCHCRIDVKTGRSVDGEAALLDELVVAGRAGVVRTNKREKVRCFQMARQKQPTDGSESLPAQLRGFAGRELLAAERSPRIHSWIQYYEHLQSRQGPGLTWFDSDGGCITADTSYSPLVRV